MIDCGHVKINRVQILKLKGETTAGKDRAGLGRKVERGRRLTKLCWRASFFSPAVVNSKIEQINGRTIVRPRSSLLIFHENDFVKNIENDAPIIPRKRNPQ